SFSYLGVVLFFLATGCLVSVSTLVGNVGLTSPYTIGVLIAGIVLAIIVWFHQTRIKNPVVELGLLKNKTFLLSVLILVLMIAGQQLFIYSMNFFLSMRPGGDATQSGFFFFFNYGATALGGVIVGILADRVNN